MPGFQVCPFSTRCHYALMLHPIVCLLLHRGYQACIRLSSVMRRSTDMSVSSQLTGSTQQEFNLNVHAFCQQIACWNCFFRCGVTLQGVPADICSRGCRRGVDAPRSDSIVQFSVLASGRLAGIPLCVHFAHTVDVAKLTITGRERHRGRLDQHRVSPDPRAMNMDQILISHRMSSYALAPDRVCMETADELLRNQIQRTQSPEVSEQRSLRLSRPYGMGPYVVVGSQNELTV